MPWFRWGASLVVLLVLALIILAPARLLLSVLPEQPLQLSGLSGTLWQGRASQASLRLAPGVLQLGEVEWRLKPLSLLTLSPSLDVSSRWGNQHLSSKVKLYSDQHVRLRDLDASIPASLAQHLAPLAIDGNLSLQFDELEIEDGAPRVATGRVVWRDASWRSPQGLQPLGTFALQLQTPEAGQLQGEIITVSGPLQASGQLGLKGRSYQVNALLSSERALDPQLERSLELFAQPTPEGYQIQLEADF